jgi:hypothetical protein
VNLVKFYSTWLSCAAAQSEETQADDPRHPISQREKYGDFPAARYSAYSSEPWTHMKDCRSIMSRGFKSRRSRRMVSANASKLV